MFTGLITAVGEIVSVSRTDAGLELVVEAPYEQVELGESISLNGVCLTVRDFAPGRFTVAAVVTTLDRTTIGDWRVGSKVNLERAMAVGDKLGGHIVQGHVDGVGDVLSAEQRDDAWILDVRVPDEIDELLVPRGSIAVDGVSLTVVELPAANVMRLSIIEHTMRHTTLGSLRAGARVHLEGDILAKHLKRLAAPFLKS